MSKKIAIINFKGGVGKTTLAYHLAAYLAKENRVLLVDMDHQSSLSLVLLGPKYEQFANQDRTSNQIFAYFCDRELGMPSDEIIVKNPILVREEHSWKDYYPNLDLVPSQLQLDDTEIDLASTTYGSHAKSEWSKRTLLCTWIDKASVQKNYDYVIFDCAPATKLVTQNAVAASDYYLVPVIPDEVSTRGVTHLVTLVHNKIDKKLEALREMANIKRRDTPKSYVRSTKLVGIVPFMAKPAGAAASGLINLHTMQIEALRRTRPKQLTKSIVKHYTGVAESMSNGWPVFNERWNPNVSNPGVIGMMEKVCAEIIKRLN